MTFTDLVNRDALESARELGRPPPFTCPTCGVPLRVACGWGGYAWVFCICLAGPPRLATGL